MFQPQTVTPGPGDADPATQTAHARRPRRASPAGAADAPAETDSVALQALPATLPRRGGRPLYRSLTEVLRQAIDQGRWAVGDALPSEGAIGARFDVSRITVRHALQLLQFEGYVRTQRARPAVVLAPQSRAVGDTRADSLSDLIQGATDAQMLMVSWKPELAPEPAAILGLPPQQPVACLRGVLRRDGQRLARTTFHFLPAVGERLRLEDFDDAVVFRVLQARLGIRVADVRMKVWADTADDEDVAQLGCAPGSAILCSRIVYRDGQGQPFEVTDARSPAALRSYSFHVKVDPT
jgi:GntR family transcriptional regulator